MDITSTYDALSDHAVVRFRGAANLDEAVQLINRTIVRACNENVRRLLINATDLGVVGIPTLADRYFIVREWARLASGRVKISLAIKEHLIEPGRFGVMVARNAGLDCDVFSREGEALEWLLKGVEH